MDRDIIVLAGATGNLGRRIATALLDFTKLPPRTNRNLDLRREFHKRLLDLQERLCTFKHGC